MVEEGGVAVDSLFVSPFIITELSTLKMFIWQKKNCHFWYINTYKFEIPNFYDPDLYGPDLYGVDLYILDLYCPNFYFPD